ncbi:MAG: hypothetical protein ACPGSB_07385 [Opitutales bacterium]
MSDPNFDHSEGDDWEEFPSNEFNWSETQWRTYLYRSDRDTAKFLSIYNSVKNKPNHLDEVATLMGWDAEDISMTDDFSFIEMEDELPEADQDQHESGPYTLHRHPVFVVTRSLYRYLHQSWEHYISENPRIVSTKLCWDYANSLHQAEMNVLLSIQALDLGDFGLSVCHLKNSLSALNQSLNLLNELTHPNQDYLENFRKEVRIRLFDLRELWIRVMGDCRHECQHRRDEQE